MKLKIGQKVYKSELGYKGFYYPEITLPLTLSSGVRVKPLPWCGPSTLMAVQTEESVTAFDSENNYHQLGGHIWVAKISS